MKKIIPSLIVGLIIGIFIGFLIPASSTDKISETENWIGQEDRFEVIKSGYTAVKSIDCFEKLKSKNVDIGMASSGSDTIKIRNLDCWIETAWGEPYTSAPEGIEDICPYDEVTNHLAPDYHANCYCTWEKLV